MFSRVVVAFVYGHGYDKIAGEENVPPKAASPTKGSPNNTLQLLFCFFGLQVSYLTWGVLQEKIMTKVRKAYRYCLPSYFILTVIAS